MDEIAGPYKVVSKLVGAREPLKYSIVRQHRNDVFLQEIVPDAGVGDTARQICNLLNREHKMLLDNRAAIASELGETDGTEESRAGSGAGLEGTDI